MSLSIALYILYIYLHTHTHMVGSWSFQEMQFKADVLPGRSWPHYTLQFHITLPNDLLFQRSSRPTTANKQKPTKTLTKPINIINKRIKMSNYFLVFQMKLYFIIFLSSTHSLTNAHIHSTDTRSHTVKTYMGTEMSLFLKQLNLQNCN